MSATQRVPLPHSAFAEDVRTGLTLLVVGLSFIELPVFRSPLFVIPGWAFVPLSVITFAVGAWRFWKVRQDISRAGHAGAV